MKRELDEIEMELGKERTLKVGDRVKTPRGEGEVVAINPRGDCEVKFMVESPDYWWFRASECIPVEPERVKWYYRMSCATRSCAANDEGMCNVSINGLATCSKHQWPKPSPGLLQRMGMTWECEDYPVVRLSPGTYHIGNITVVVQG